MTELDRLIELVGDHAKLGLAGAKSLYLRFGATAFIAEMLYKKLVRLGEIEPIESLPEVKKRELWKESLGAISPKLNERDNFLRRKIYCRAAYLIEVVLTQDA